jgi:phosphoribosylformylglycinamidine cyclo-ligase
VFTQLIEGMTAACRTAGCALLGGETAEMPGVYALGDYDLAGFIIGMVEAGRSPDPAKIKTGDVLIGLPSSGLHTNGFSLVRKVFEDVPLTRVFPELGRPLSDVLLEPHASYLDDLGSLRWKGAAHITGGGLIGNVPRCLPDRLGARLDREAWNVPPIFELIRKRGRIADDEMYGTFNMGLGMILVVDRGEVPSGALVVGEVVRHSGPDRVVIR